MRRDGVVPRALLAIAVGVTMAGCRVPRASAGADQGASASVPSSSPGPGLARGVTTADSMIAAAVGTQTAGAVLVVSKDGRIIHERAFGHAQLNDSAGRRLATPRPMRTSTMFDLASVTKVLATTYAVMLLADRGAIDVDAPVGRYLADFRGPGLDSITVRHLLSHSSGVVQWQPLYYQAANAGQTYRAIREMPLGWEVGSGRHYSDLGFMLLGYIVERVGGLPLDELVDRELYRPLGLRSTAFNPRARGFSDFAATEAGNGYERRMVYDTAFGYDYDGDPRSWEGWRHHVLDGEVNDGNAWYAHAGVAGHAGLFSTAAEVSVLVDLLTSGGVHAGRRHIRAETVRRFLTRDRFGHYLGWQVPPGMPEGSFAHNGFTGTWVLGVPAHGLSIVILTNRQNIGANAAGFFPNVGPLTQAVSRALVNGARADAGSQTR